jgi:dihydrofolate reductase
MMEVVLIAVVSLDGCLTRHDASGVSTWASADDQQHFRETLRGCDASVMGSATYLAARDHVLANLTSTRLRVVMSRTPERFGSDAAPGRLEFTASSPSEVVDHLRADGFQRCALLGGGQIYSQFLAEGLVDSMLLTIEPRIFGTGIRLAGTDTPIDPGFTLDEVSRLGPETALLKLSRRV